MCVYIYTHTWYTHTVYTHTYILHTHTHTWQVEASVMGNANAQKEACVLGAVRGGGVRYWPDSGVLPSLMALSQVCHK